MRKFLFLVALIFAVSFTTSTALAMTNKEDPTLVRQPTPWKVVQEHLNALNACSLERVMAQYPEVAEIQLPHAVIVTGRQALHQLFAGFVKPHSKGGLCGLKFTSEHINRVGDTFNIQWRAEAPFLVQTYRGSDAYETKDGLMYAQVTTFNGAELKFKY